MFINALKKSFKTLVSLGVVGGTLTFILISVLDAKDQFSKLISKAIEVKLGYLFLFFGVLGLMIKYSIDYSMEKYKKESDDLQSDLSTLEESNSKLKDEIASINEKSKNEIITLQDQIEKLTKELMAFKHPSNGNIEQFSEGGLVFYKNSPAYSRAFAMTVIELKPSENKVLCRDDDSERYFNVTELYTPQETKEILDEKNGVYDNFIDSLKS